MQIKVKKRNAQGHFNTWVGYRLLLDVAYCGVPITAALTKALRHTTFAVLAISVDALMRLMLHQDPPPMHSELVFCPCKVAIELQNLKRIGKIRFRTGI